LLLAKEHISSGKGTTFFANCKAEIAKSQNYALFLHFLNRIHTFTVEKDYTLKLE
jgi:hypothetical protein